MKIVLQYNFCSDGDFFNDPKLFFYNILDQKYKVSITEWYQNLADTAGVFAHELGHALGMDHDFTSSGGDRFDRNGVKCTDIDGLMDYGARSSVDKFSTCSKQDFRDQSTNSGRSDSLGLNYSAT